jgi:hypothetical protein
LTGHSTYVHMYILTVPTYVSTPIPYCGPDMYRCMHVPAGRGSWGTGRRLPRLSNGRRLVGSLALPRAYKQDKISRSYADYFIQTEWCWYHRKGSRIFPVDSRKLTSPVKLHKGHKWSWWPGMAWSR